MAVHGGRPRRRATATIISLSNWILYLLEVTQALMVSCCQAQVSLVKNDEEIMTPFERKYKASGQPLWQLDADLSKET